MTPPPTHQEPTPRLPRLPDQGRIREVYNVVVPVIAVVTLLTAFAALGWSWQNSRADHRQDQQRITDTEKSAVVGCENANESRKASRTLWNFVVDLSLASNKNASPAEIAYLGQVRDWINEVYQPHDCTDLSKKYELPPPPTIPVLPS